MKEKMEKLKVENERLKNERKGNKTMHSQIMIKPSLNETKIEKTIVVEEYNKENSSMQWYINSVMKLIWDMK